MDPCEQSRPPTSSPGHIHNKLFTWLLSIAISTIAFLPQYAFHIISVFSFKKTLFFQSELSKCYFLSFLYRSVIETSESSHPAVDRRPSVFNDPSRFIHHQGNQISIPYLTYFHYTLEHYKKLLK